MSDIIKIIRVIIAAIDPRLNVGQTEMAGTALEHLAHARVQQVGKRHALAYVRRNASDYDPSIRNPRYRPRDI